MFWILFERYAEQAEHHNALPPREAAFRKAAMEICARSSQNPGLVCTEDLCNKKTCPSCIHIDMQSVCINNIYIYEVASLYIIS